MRLGRFGFAFLALTFAMAASSRAPAADVDITLLQFGVGSAWRAGDCPVGIRVQLTSNLPDPTDAWVQWEVPDADGDIAACGRKIALTPGRPTPLWLYAPLPGPQWFNSTTVTLVRAFAEKDGRRGDELGVVRFSPRDDGTSQDVGLERTLILQLGKRSMGLEDFRNAFEPEESQSSNEDTRIIWGVRPDELPDRWYPLKSFEAVVWGPDASPQELRLDAAAALVNYVERGGHLVIVLPEAGSPWGLGSDQSAVPAELAALLPRQAPRRDEAVALDALIPIFSKSRSVPRSAVGKPITFEMVIRVFKDLPVRFKSSLPDSAGTGASSTAFNAIDKPYEPLVALPDGRVVAIQRTFGHGRITIVGVDVSYGQLRSVELPQGDVFWNRILGRRADTPRPNDIRAMESLQILGHRGLGQSLNLMSGRLFEDEINLPTQAGAGILMALVLFISYFALAGPFGFALLKQRRLHKHAWLAFVAVAAIFTGIAWGAVNLARDTVPKLEHITYLDHVAQPPGTRRADERQLQRAVGWLNVYIPGYGRHRVTIDSLEGERDLLLSWASPHRRSEHFPNVDRYWIDMAQKPADYEVPGRATAKQFYAHYLGPVSDEWGGMFTVDLANPVRVEPTAEASGRLVGKITHHLPGELVNVRLFWILDVRQPRQLLALDSMSGLELPHVQPFRSGSMPNVGRTYSVSKWAPGETIDFALLDLRATGKTDLASFFKTAYIDPYDTAIPETLRAVDRARFREMLSFFNQLPPPRYLREGSGASAKDPTNVHLHREVGRELDLSPWFTRPCVIIIGELKDSPCPIPMRLNGRELISIGTTIVRWIFPLELNEAKIVPSKPSD